MKILSFLLLFTICFSSAYAQNQDSLAIIALNQQIDTYVVQQDTSALSRLYADDFVFSHGSGKVEGKQSWFKSVVKGSFISRNHDSVSVELHPAIAIARGKLTVQKKSAAKADRYFLKYIRVYASRNKQWQLVSHMTTFEVHEK